MYQDKYSITAEKGAYVSIAAYLFLSVLKLSIGYFGHSQGLWADGLNNTTDILASLAVLIGLKISKRPPDEDHAYGHRRAETIASLVSAFIMASVGVQVIVTGIQTFFSGHHETPSILTSYTALFSAIFMYGIYRYNLNISKKINSASINAVAQDNKSDALVSLGALVGILGTQIGINWLDSVAALLVGIIICKTAWSIFRDSSYSLTDGFDEQLLQTIGETISKTPGVKEMSEIKARMHGNQILVESTIHVDSTLSILEGHHITEKVEENLSKQHNIKQAIIHVEPFTK
ncbi:cation diffusion facilitator family transporter [Peribacillus sp. FSL H8-0477]|uniref:cation diffusion facilitator family transporter n=1 Tax=Peribacillus sp. FSL H8-0477 TaxID=2921388 RepID=UPI0030F512DC